VPLQEELANEQDSWKAQVDAYMQKLHVESHERAAALALAASEQQELEQKLWEVCVACVLCAVCSGCVWFRLLRPSVRPAHGQERALCYSYTRLLLHRHPLSLWTCSLAPKQAERKLEEAEQQLQQHSSSSQAAKEQQQLTPLPTDWGPAAELAAVCQASSADTTQPLCVVAHATQHVLRVTYTRSFEHSAVQWK
jgi:hypothetical protein